MISYQLNACVIPFAKEDSGHQALSLSITVLDTPRRYSCSKRADTIMFLTRRHHILQ